MCVLRMWRPLKMPLVWLLQLLRLLMVRLLQLLRLLMVRLLRLMCVWWLQLLRQWWHCKAGVGCRWRWRCCMSGNLFSRLMSLIACMHPRLPRSRLLCLVHRC